MYAQTNKEINGRSRRQSHRFVMSCGRYIMRDFPTSQLQITPISWNTGHFPTSQLQITPIGWNTGHCIIITSSEHFNGTTSVSISLSTILSLCFSAHFLSTSFYLSATCLSLPSLLSPPLSSPRRLFFPVCLPPPFCSLSFSSLSHSRLSFSSLSSLSVDSVASVTPSHPPMIIIIVSNSNINFKWSFY